MTTIRRLSDLGQSVWYDYIRRDLVRGPALPRLIEAGLRGMTSNPTIFAKAITETGLYDEQIRRLRSSGATPEAIFESLMVSDVRDAADVFRSVFDATDGSDGFVSIEVSPLVAHDTEATIVEARRLWNACDRPNVMIKIPATAEGIAAIRQCLVEAININITLLFSVARYREVMEAYLAALEQRVKERKPIDTVRSVASFFVSRVDTKVDSALDGIAADEDRPSAQRRAARELRGKAAVANAWMAYQEFESVFDSPRFTGLMGLGVRHQRPLWASTSTKDPAYPELYYVEALVAPHTVDTMPPETFEAYLNRGRPELQKREEYENSRIDLERLAELKIDLSNMLLELEEEGTRKFVSSYDEVLRVIRQKQEVA